jgi:hypothetical protein
VELSGRLPLAGRDCVVRLGFYRGGLYFVEIGGRFAGDEGESDAATKDFRTRERRKWFDAVAGLLVLKYGPPVTEREEKDHVLKQWSKDGVAIELEALDFAFLVPTRERTVDLMYRDIERWRLASGVNPADTSKL